MDELNRLKTERERLAMNIKDRLALVGGVIFIHGSVLTDPNLIELGCKPFEDVEVNKMVEQYKAISDKELELGFELSLLGFKLEINNDPQ